MGPKDLIRIWVKHFNNADAYSLAQLYAADAISHQVGYDPIIGNDAIRTMFAGEFSRAKMVCNIENIFQDGEWVILEWTDPLGLRGCGFFQIRNEKIIFTRGYFDQITFNKIQGLAKSS
ncbi:MAG: nuclear transport factor 2 family protein [Anaerolineae bacterium]